MFSRVDFTIEFIISLAYAPASLVEECQFLRPNVIGQILRSAILRRKKPASLTYMPNSRTIF